MNRAGRLRNDGLAEMSGRFWISLVLMGPTPRVAVAAMIPGVPLPYLLAGRATGAVRTRPREMAAGRRCGHGRAGLVGRHPAGSLVTSPGAVDRPTAGGRGDA